MAVGTSFKITQSAGDSAGPTISGGQTLAPPEVGNNALQINQEVVADGRVTPAAEPAATTYDVNVVAETIDKTKVLAMVFKAVLVNLNANASTPLIYVKLKLGAGSSHDLVIPLVPDQTFIWTPPATVPAIGDNTLMSGTALSANFTVTCTPDKTSDIQLVGTIELSR